ncbi:flagellar export chaperone FliS [Paenibacillus sp. PL2-23]|uniref:flagellar export chaperone FliS n=1 Tax=Paenibacillus sp. PL2-23 TaxID=2100729 RepID=UPI0030F5AD8B
MMKSPYQIYQQSSVQTASGGQLIIMLYEGAIRFAKAGIEGIQVNNYEKANHNLKKAQAIIHELIASLNHGYDISKNLVRIYEYLLHLLIKANVNKSVSPIEEAISHLLELKEAWKQVVKGSTGMSMKEAGVQ